MNSEQIVSLIRQALLFGGGFLVAKGYLSAEELAGIVGAALALGASGWALYSRRKAGIVASAAAFPDVAKVITTTELAATVPNAKVVPPSIY